MCSAANGQQDWFFSKDLDTVFFWGAAKKALQSWLTLSPIVLGTGKWLFSKGNYYWGDPFFTSMGIGGRVCLWKMATVQLLLAQPSSGLGFQSSQNDHQLVRRVCVYIMFDFVYWAQNDLTCWIPANDINCIVILWLLNGPLECHYIFWTISP